MSDFEVLWLNKYYHCSFQVCLFDSDLKSFGFLQHDILFIRLGI